MPAGSDGVELLRCARDLASGRQAHQATDESWRPPSDPWRRARRLTGIRRAPAPVIRGIGPMRSAATFSPAAASIPVMQRREFGFGMLALLLAHRALATAVPTPRLPLRLFTRRQARVYVLGFGDARDESWATPELRRAFQSSADLWLEVSHDPGTEPDAAAKRDQLTHDSAG